MASARHVAVALAAWLTGSVASAADPFADLPQGACGGLEQIAPAAEPVSLLSDRLRVTPLRGAEGGATPVSIMAAPAGSERETRVFLASGERKLVLLTEESYARAGADWLERVSKLADMAGARVAEEVLPSGLRAVLAVERALAAPEGEDAIPVAHAFTRLADDTLQRTSVFVNPEVLGAGGAGCPALALRLLRTLSPGERTLELAPGPRRLGAKLELDLPAGFASARDEGPDFDVFHVYAVRQLSDQAPELGIYQGGHPSFQPEPGARTRKARIAGQPVTWHEREADGAFHGEVLIETPGQDALHVFYWARDLLTAAELTRIAESLRRVR